MKTVLLLLLFIAACNDPVALPVEESLPDKIQNIDSINNANAINFSIKYNSIFGWDTVKKYTYQLQDNLVGKRISFIAILNDIVKTDTGYEIKIVSTLNPFHRQYIGKMLIDSSMLPKLGDPDFFDTYFAKGCFVCEISYIKTFNPEISSEIENEGTDDSYAYLDLHELKNLLYFKGRLIDFLPYKK